MQVRFTVQGASAYGDIVALVDASGPKTQVSRALLRAANGFEVVLKDEKPPGGRERKFSNTVDI